MLRPGSGKGIGLVRQASEGSSSNKIRREAASRTPVEALPQAQLVKKCIGHVRCGCAAGQCKLRARLAQAVQDSAQMQDVQPCEQLLQAGCASHQ